MDSVTPGPDGKTPMLAVRVPRELQDATKARAAEKGETVTAVVNRALKRYVQQRRMERRPNELESGTE